MDDQSSSDSLSQQANNPALTCLITKLTIDSEPKNQEPSWLVRIMILAMDSPGFLSGEIIPPRPPENMEWRLVQRFFQAEQAVSWRNSENRHKLLQEMAAPLPGIAAIPKIVEELSAGERSTVATAIVTKVVAGMEAAYRSWEGRVQAAQAKYPGYRGSYVQPPTSNAQAHWTTVLRFDTPESLENWFNCEERKALVTQASQFVSSTNFQTLTNSFPGWFPTDPETGKGPPVWKTFMMVLLSLYPIVMVEIKYLMPLLNHIPSALANFIGNIVSVAITSWITIPYSIQLFSWWMLPADDASKTLTEMKGTALLCCIFAAELALLWNLLG